MEEIKKIDEISAEIDSEEETLEMKNYYLFKPFEFVTSELQADENGVFECENGSNEDLFAKEKKGLFLSDFIRKIGFVSKETTLKVIEEFLEKVERLKEENEILKKENSEMKERILKYQEEAKNKEKTENKNKKSKEIKNPEKNSGEENLENNEKT